MDRDDGSTVDTFYSISDAILGTSASGNPPSKPPAAAGDVLTIFGATSGGSPVAYADDPSYSDESFPLPIPAGVTITAAAGPPVYVVSVNGSDIFEIGSGSQLTRIEKIGIGGGASSIQAHATTAGIKLYLKEIDFGPGAIGFDALASAGPVEVTLDTCRIARPPTYPSPAPAVQTFTTGISLHAGGNPAALKADILSLEVAGNFPSSAMAPTAPPGGAHDLALYSPNLTRIVEIHSQGAVPEHPGRDSGDFTADPIPIVYLGMGGGVLDGKSSPGSSAGWDVGVFASTMSGDAGAGIDYGNGFEISLSGTLIRKMRAAGIYADTHTETRGNVRLLGASAIKHTGIQGGLAADYLGSGLHAVNREGYLGITAQDSLFQYNAGHGVYAYDVYSIRALTHFPVGLFLGLKRSQIHDNDGSGVALDGMKDKGTIALSLQGANVGGTHDNYDPNGTNYLGPQVTPSFIAEGNEPVPGSMPHGQGYIDRCAISHNSGAGVRTYVRGSSAQTGLPGNIVGEAGGWSMASCRIENSFLWANEAGGVRTELLPAFAGNPSGPLAFMPVVHSTVAQNGSAQSAPYNMEVSLVKPSGFIYTGDLSGTPIQTELFNSIFQRTTHTDLDWGPGLEALVADDPSGTGPSATPAHAFIGVAGVRASWSTMASNLFTPPFSVNGFSVSAPSPFVGPSGWGPNDPDQFFLTGPSSGVFYSSPSFFTVATAAMDCKDDYSGDQRPTSGYATWDKGGEEF